MAFKIKNITDDPRKIRIHKTAKSFFIRAGEEITVPYAPVVANPHIFEVTNLDELNETEEALNESAEEETEVVEKKSRKKSTKQEE